MVVGTRGEQRHEQCAESLMWGICMAGVGEASQMSFYMSAEFFDTTGRRGPHGVVSPCPSAHMRSPPLHPVDYAPVH